MPLLMSLVSDQGLNLGLGSESRVLTTVHPWHSYYMINYTLRQALLYCFYKCQLTLILILTLSTIIIPLLQIRKLGTQCKQL